MTQNNPRTNLMQEKDIHNKIISKKKEIHDGIISKLEERLKKMGCETQKNMEYSIYGEDGECDLYGINKEHKQIFIFEIKTENSGGHQRKAVHQLKKDNKMLDVFFNELNDYKRINFYAYTNKEKRFGYDVKKVDIKWKK